MSKKTRLDQLIVERNLASSRSQAQRLILSGNVLVDDEPVTKSGHSVAIDCHIRIKENEHPYVSRGGLKLKKALETFQVSVTDRIALDIGASTGGFTDVLLQEGIKKVFTIDVGKNQLDWKIRSDKRVVSAEGINARYLEFDQIGQKVDLIVMDVSFISITKIIPALIQFATPITDWITLIKPQFEVGKDKVGKGGIVRSEEDRQLAVESVSENLEKLGLKRVGLIESPITGMTGNQEYLAHWKLKN